MLASYPPPLFLGPRIPRIESPSTQARPRPGEIPMNEPATSRHVQAKIAMRRHQAHGLELEGVPDGELLGELEAKRVAATLGISTAEESQVGREVVGLG